MPEEAHTHFLLEPSRKNDTLRVVLVVDIYVAGYMRFSGPSTTPPRPMDLEGFD